LDEFVVSEMLEALGLGSILMVRGCVRVDEVREVLSAEGFCLSVTCMLVAQVRTHPQFRRQRRFGNVRRYGDTDFQESPCSPRSAPGVHQSFVTPMISPALSAPSRPLGLHGDGDDASILPSG
jgi:hypothetical protein